jgi:hypothetical protein
VRILLVDMPTLLREIIAIRLAAEPDLVVGTCDSIDEFPGDVAGGGVDVVILNPADPDPLHLKPLMGGAGGAIRAIAVDGGEGLLYELCSLPDLSPESLLRAIRSAAQPI